MTTTIMSSSATTIRWADVIEYPHTGAKSKLLLEDGNCRYMLMALAARRSSIARAESLLGQQRKYTWRMKAMTLLEKLFLTDTG